MQAASTRIRHFGFLKCLFLCAGLVFSCAFPLTEVFAVDACWSKQQQLVEVDEWVEVARVIDGDTVHLNDGRKVRLIGINTPEIGRNGEASQAYAYQAYQSLAGLLQGHKKVGLSFDKDKYDRYKRLLAYLVLPDGRSVEQSLLAQGLAVSIAVPPNIRHLKCFRAIEQQANRARLKLWQLPEMQYMDAGEVSTKATGYRFVRAKVKGYSESRKSLYLKLTDKLSIRIAKKDRDDFEHLNLKALPGKKIRVRGWLNRYKGRQSISLRSADNLQRL